MWKAEMINDGEVVCYGVEDTPEGACFDLIRVIMNDWKAGIHDVCGDYVKEIGEAIVEIESMPSDGDWSQDWHSQCGDFVAPWTLRVRKADELGTSDAPPVIVNEETTAYAPFCLTPEVGNPALAKEVYEGIYSASDSLHDFGGNVAYLVGGILTGSSLAFHGTLDECEAEFLEFLRDVFEEEHPVWKHVDLSNVDQYGYVFKTDSTSGVIEASCWNEACEKLREMLPDHAVDNGAWGWVEDTDGERYEIPEVI